MKIDQNASSHFDMLHSNRKGDSGRESSSVEKSSSSTVASSTNIEHYSFQQTLWGLPKGILGNVGRCKLKLSESTQKVTHDQTNEKLDAIIFSI